MEVFRDEEVRDVKDLLLVQYGLWLATVGPTTNGTCRCRTARWFCNCTKHLRRIVRSRYVELLYGEFIRGDCIHSSTQ
jgi:hypothetical protein